MQEEKSFVYTLILGICMLLCLLMIGRMMLGHPEAETQPVPSGEAAEEQEEQNVGFQLSEEGLREMIAQALPFAPDDLSAAIHADQTISVSANVQRQTLADSGLVPGNLRTALLFLPDSCKVSANWTASVRDGAISLQCRQAEIAGIALPEDITAALSDQIAEAINRQLAAQQIVPAELRWEDGTISIIT